MLKYYCVAIIFGTTCEEMKETSVSKFYFYDIFLQYLFEFFSIVCNSNMLWSKNQEIEQTTK